jgi:hypothetical protein
MALYAAQPPAAPVEKLVAAAREWVTERNPKDAAEKALFAAVFRAFPEDAHTRESCDCGGDCDECPPAAQVEQWLQECEAAPTLTFPDGLRGARRQAMESHASMVQPSSAGTASAGSLETKLRDAHAALRSIAEGNLGDSPWQANYETIKQVARNALSGEPVAVPQTASESQASCNHWPGQARCGVCGMGYRPEERRT